MCISINIKETCKYFFMNTLRVMERVTRLIYFLRLGTSSALGIPDSSSFLHPHNNSHIIVDYGSCLNYS